MRFGIRKVESDPVGEYRVVYLDNNVEVGRVYQEVDGFYVYDPSEVRGYMDEPTLSGISELLSYLNASWDQQIAEYFDGQMVLFDVPWSELSRAAVQKMINGFH